MGEMLKTSPQKARYGRHSPSAAMATGTLFHTAILEPDELEKRYLVSDNLDRRTKAGKEAVAEAEAQGLILLKSDQMDEAMAARDAVHAITEASNLIKGNAALFEQAVFWNEGKTQAKAKLDILRPSLNAVPDLKTAQDASPSGFARAVANFGYHMQAAWYLRGVTKVTGEKHDDFPFIVVEPVYPYACAVYRLDKAAMAEGLAMCKHALKLYRECSEADAWPGYQSQTLELPKWSFQYSDPDESSFSFGG